MNEHELAAYRYEIKNWNNIPLGSQHCHVGCIFCKINGDPYLRRFPHLPRITFEELVAGFQFLDPGYRFVRLGAGVLVAPHTDPYLHPEIYDFIRHTCRTFPQKSVTTVSTATYLDLERLDELHAHGNFGIDLSLITMQASRERIVPMATREHLVQVLRDAPLRKISLMFTGDLGELARDIELLVEGALHNSTEQILVRRIEHVRFSPAILRQISEQSIAGYDEAVNFLMTHYPEIEYTVPYLDERYPRAEYHDEAKQRLDELRSWLGDATGQHILVVAPASTGTFFRTGLQDLPGVAVAVAPNLTYGGSVTVGGLLTGHEVARAVAEERTPPQVVIVPKEMYDLDNQDLTGGSRAELAKQLNVCIHPM